MRLENLRWGLTYDDVLLLPAASDVLPRTWRVEAAHGNANSITYSVSANLIM